MYTVYICILLLVFKFLIEASRKHYKNYPNYQVYENIFCAKYGVSIAVIKLDNKLTVWLSNKLIPEINFTWIPLGFSTTHLFSSSHPEY